MAAESGVPPDSLSPQVSFLQIWYLALVRPSEKAYQAIYTDPSASIARGLLWMVLASLASSTIALLARAGDWTDLISQYSARTGLDDLAVGSLLVLLCLIPILTVFAVVGLIVYAAVIQYVGGAFGGQGTLGRCSTCWR